MPNHFLIFHEFVFLYFESILGPIWLRNNFFTSRDGDKECLHSLIGL